MAPLLGPPGARGPGSLNRLNPWFLRRCHSPLIYRYISEMVEDRWVHVARCLTSIEFSFDPCNIYRDSLRGVSRGGKNVPKTLLHIPKKLKKTTYTKHIFKSSITVHSMESIVRNFSRKSSDVRFSNSL